jgi:CO/xanthine dehydrogenase Mo-binding subunit
VTSKDSTAAGFSGMIDARARVTGRVGYTIDLELPGMLHANLLRSTVPHARIRRIDVTRARRLPGVAVVLTGADLAARSDLRPWFGPVFRDQPVLAIEKVRFVGEPVAAVAAADLDTAREAAGLIDVEYEELPGVFTLDEALAPDATILHEGPPRVGQTFADVIIDAAGGTNVCNHFKLRKGHIEDGFSEAAHIFEDTFTSPAVQHVPLETHSCLAQVSDGQVTVWAGTQIPFVTRSQLAEIFKIPASRVRVIVPTLGGGYGAKCYPKIEPVTAVLAAAARRPVKLHLTREEEFVTITKHAMRISLRTGVRRDGTIVARQSTCHFNTGAYADIGPRLIKNGGYGTAGPYHIPNVWVDSYAVYTNLPPAGAFRGYGIPQAAWAYETQMDMIAERLGLDPYELRMRNLLVDGDRVMTGEPIEDAHFRDLLETAADRIGWDFRGWQSPPERRGARVRAKGLSCIIKSTVTPSTSSAVAKLNDDGSLEVLTSAVEMGQGLKTALAIMAAERLGLPVQQVSVSEPDTAVTPYDQQTSSSRGTFSMGSAVGMAAGEVRQQLLERAAGLLEASVEDLECDNGLVQVRGDPDTMMSYGDVVRRSRCGNLIGRATFQTTGGLDPETGQGVGSVHWHQAAGAAEVEVDLETGRVEVLRYHAGVYAGRIINPVQAELQTEGNVAFGVGQALFEEMIYDNGELQNGNLGDYMIASIKDMPGQLDLNVLEHAERNELHGIGETSLPPVVPAIGNAVYRATGVRITDLPITPEKVLRGLRAAGAQGDGDAAPVPAASAVEGDAR